MIRFLTLASGSSGNSTYVGTEDEGILIDAGVSTRRLTKCLEGAGVSLNTIKGVLVTHEHGDHVAGLEVLTRKCRLPVYCTEKTGERLQETLRAGEERCQYLTAGQTFEVGELKIESFPLSHDAADPVGFVVNYKGTRLGLATDTGVITSGTKKVLQGCQALILEANHDVEMLKKGRYPYPLKQRILSSVGHLSNEDAGSALLEVVCGDTEKVVLAHLSAENNRADLALDTVSVSLDRGGIGTKQLTVSVAPRNEPHPLIEV